MLILSDVPILLTYCPSGCGHVTDDVTTGFSKLNSTSTSHTHSNVHNINSKSRADLLTYLLTYCLGGRGHRGHVTDDVIWKI